jgi:hypothetical protein
VLSEHRNCDNTATIANSENARSRMVASSAGKCEYGGQRRMSYVMSEFRLLDLTLFFIKNNANLQSTPSGAIRKCVRGSKPEGRSHPITTLRHIQ